MKAEQFLLVGKKQQSAVVARILEIDLDGKVKVTISNAGDKSSKQRGLQWRWYTDISLAGIGGKHEDTKEGVHLLCKWRWAIPILLRDDEVFSEIHKFFMHRHIHDPIKMEQFVEDWVKTEPFSSSQMAEYLTSIENHYGIKLGVNLTDPENYGKNLLRTKPVK